MFPRVGIPRHFGSYQEYVSVIDAMLSTGAIPEPGFLWWDVRLRPCLGTIEIRIMDAQSRVTDAVALTALVQCLVHRCAHGPRASDISPEVLAENRFLAARDGVRAQLIDRGPARRPVQDALQELFEDCRAMAPQLGCVSDLAQANALAGDPGAARQRRHVKGAGLAGLPAWLAGQYAPAAQLTAAA